MKQFGLFFLLLPIVLPAQVSLIKSVPMTIKWTDKIPGDFSFIGHWDYALGVARKKDGRAGCADNGFCPERCYGMLDSNGIVLPDSAEIFYSILDTTHYYHNISCEAWCYEWAGTDYIDVYGEDYRTIALATETNIATHSSLRIVISGDTCWATIHLNSITPSSHQMYFCKGGFISIDKELWKRGLMKAWFSFDFDHRENPAEPMYWKGNIYKSLLDTSNREH